MTIELADREHYDRLTLVFTGRLDPDNFTAFVHHRAARLSIDARIGHADVGRIEVAVSGKGDLIDMFEMACSLGPLGCLVEETSRHG